MAKHVDASIFREIYPGLRAYAAVVGPSEDEPDDLVQEALAKVLKATTLEALDHPGAYLRTTIANLAANRRRKLGRWRGVVVKIRPDVDVAPDYPSDVSFLDVLSPTDRAIIFMTEVEGRTGSEVANILDLTENAVHLRLSRSRAKLREHLSREAV